MLNIVKQISQSDFGLFGFMTDWLASVLQLQNFRNY